MVTFFYSLTSKLLNQQLAEPFRMNHKHCRLLTDRQNVLHVFAKHTKSQRDVRVVPDCNSDSSRAKKTARSGNTSKVKRLKTRKERSRMTGERRQDIHPPCCHQTPGRRGYAEDRPRPRAGDCAALAARLCSALQLPMLCRRNLLSESREALLQALQGSHGPRLTENLLRLRQHVSRRRGPSPEVHGGDHGNDSTSDTQTSGYREDVAGLKKSRPSAHRATSSRRRRKQLFPQKVEPHHPEPQHKDTAMQWNPSVMELAGDPSGEFPQTDSPPPDHWSFPRMRLY
ncbi:hypothetical protein COCON_G00003800 [Conger conger]|uniref:Uncharacterized protein n=1 Tax=Conger conger TaxID=82655 RepID=A0A9Q1E171_CONCO|nr:hypothetical protein COCON_G00003800 [Conger conger]